MSKPSTKVDVEHDFMQGGDVDSHRGLCEE